MGVLAARELEALAVGLLDSHNSCAQPQAPLFCNVQEAPGQVGEGLASEAEVLIVFPGEDFPEKQPVQDPLKALQEPQDQQPH